jgi:hypothetical protein
MSYSARQMGPSASRRQDPNRLHRLKIHFCHFWNVTHIPADESQRLAAAAVSQIGADFDALHVRRGDKLTKPLCVGGPCRCLLLLERRVVLVLEYRIMLRSRVGGFFFWGWGVWFSG